MHIYIHSTSFISVDCSSQVSSFTFCNCILNLPAHVSCPYKQRRQRPLLHKYDPVSYLLQRSSKNRGDFSRTPEEDPEQCPVYESTDEPVTNCDGMMLRVFLQQWEKKRGGQKRVGCGRGGEADKAVVMSIEIG